MSLSINNISEIIGFIILLASFLGLIYKGIRKMITAIKSVMKRFEDAAKQLEYVHKEVKPNSGSSLYDKINSIGRELKLVRKDVLIQHHISRMILDDMINVPYCEFDRNGNLTFANKKFCEATGMTEHQLEGKGWVSIIPEDARAIVFERWIESVQNGTPFQATFDCKYCENSPVPVKYILKTSQVADAEGSVVYVTGKITKK